MGTKHVMYAVLMLWGVLSPSVVFGRVGDVDRDGIISLKDADAIAHHRAGDAVEPFDSAAADVNGDGEVNAVDAMFLAQSLYGVAARVAGLAVREWPEADRNLMSEFREVLDTSERMTYEELLARYPSERSYLSAISTRLDSACYWPDVRNRLGLTAEEQAHLSRTGVMITERIQWKHPGQGYLEIYRNDLPVLITTDAILNALHESFDNILKCLEREAITATMDRILTGTRKQLSVLAREERVPEENLQDVDMFLTVARSLLAGQTLPTLFAPQIAADEMLGRIRDLQPMAVGLFDDPDPLRILDFSQFQPRGHYAQSGYGDPWAKELSRYFQCMIWLGRIEFRVQRPRELLDSYLLYRCVSDAGLMDQWTMVDQALEQLIGEQDNVEMRAMSRFVKEASISSVADFLDPGRASETAELLIKGGYGTQRILSQYLKTDPFSPIPEPIPPAFLFMGQRFTVDSHIFSNVVFDRIVYNGMKPLRQLPSPLDAMFVFGDNAVLPELESEIREYHYARNLHALRALVDRYGTSFWEGSLYRAWLGAVRTLNKDTTDPEYPECMRTLAWASKTLNTQLASWAQLRHDTMLYTKQSYTTAVVCMYPDGFVEPYPEFYSSLGRFARNARDAFAHLQSVGMAYYDIESIRGFWDGFAETMDTLESIARKELLQTPLSAEETLFLKDVLDTVEDCAGLRFRGWFPRLHYLGETTFDLLIAADQNPTIADVHTKPSDEMGPGKVLHVATGLVNPLVIVADRGKGATVYVGPVMSYYEVVNDGVKRLQDQDWHTMLRDGTPSRPEWTRSFLVRSE